SIYLGNTCRSPIAQAVLENLIVRQNLQNWYVDSAGLRDWNVGKSPLGRTLNLLKQHGLETTHVARKITLMDFYKFDYIFGMDTSNMMELQQMTAPLDPKPRCKIQLLGSYIGRKNDEIIQDPYFSHGLGAFYKVYQQILESCENFLRVSKTDFK
ncbi:hypothetical protein KR018_001984, partial [Drosophila ironensis]